MIPYEVLNTEKLYNGPIFDLSKKTIRLPNENAATLDVIEHNGAALIIPVTDNGELVMVKQYRIGTESVLLEFPAGKFDPGEDPGECALRELEEETGYRASKISLLFETIPIAAYCTEKISVYLAEGLKPGQPKPDENEFLEVEVYPLEKLLKMVDSGELLDMKTVMGILYYARIAANS